MKPLQIVLFLFALALPLRSIAQQSGSKPLTENSKALQFQIGSNFTLTSFQGAALSYKHHLKPLLAIRVGSELSLSKSNFDLTEVDSVGDLETLSKSDQTWYYVRFNTQLIWYSESYSGISFFYGVGPFLGFSKSEKKDELVSPYPGHPRTNLDETKTGWSLGLTGLVGVEWFVSKSISLHAEYRISLGYSQEKREYNRTTISQTGKSYITGNETIKFRQLSSDGVRFGLSVYFK
jgi:opacity protein-like surface antigen